MSGRNQDREHYEFGAFRVDVAERVLTKGQQVIPLTPKAFDTLLVLVRKSGHVVEKDELLKHVWPDTFVEEGVLAVNVAAIRKALSDGEGQSHIETVPRRGYRFVGEVRKVGKASEAEDAPNDSDQRKKSLEQTMGACSGVAGIGPSWLWLVSLSVAANFNSTTVLTHPSHQLSGHRTQSHLLT